MTVHSDAHRLLSRPMQVQIPALGMESTTVRMQQCGWDFSAEQDIQYMALSVVARHRAARLFFGCRVNFDFIRAHEDARYRADFPLVFGQVDNRMPPPMVHASMYESHSPIDMAPQFTDSPLTSIEDMAIFAAAPLARTNEIIVEEREVGDLLRDILAKQEDGRQEYFKQKIRENRDGLMNAQIPNVKFHAQILSIAS